jgi:hypothetical protein
MFLTLSDFSLNFASIDDLLTHLNDPVNYTRSVDLVFDFSYSENPANFADC